LDVTKTVTKSIQSGVCAESPQAFDMIVCPFDLVVLTRNNLAHGVLFRGGSMLARPKVLLYTAKAATPRETAKDENCFFLDQHRTY
jgi:hypothetical protein